MDQNSQKKFFQTAYNLRDERIKKGYGWPLEVDPQLINFMKDIRKSLQSGMALDIGCGQGRHAIYFAEEGFDSYGIDYIESAIEEARQTALDKGIDNVNFEVMDVLKLNFPKDFFNLVLDWSVLDHIKPEDWSIYLSNILKVLKTGGYLILSEFSANDERVKDKEENFYEDDNHYDHYFKMSEIEDLFGEYFEIIKTNETVIETEPKHLMLNVLLRKNKGHL
jgi:2-polyprenyl-3-methyl-5-hydroxy-6-metoxy-1,4-benzoquinol methylase